MDTMCWEQRSHQDRQKLKNTLEIRRIRVLKWIADGNSNKLLKNICLTVKAELFVSDSWGSGMSAQMNGWSSGTRRKGARNRNFWSWILILLARSLNKFPSPSGKSKDRNKYNRTQAQKVQQLSTQDWFYQQIRNYLEEAFVRNNYKLISTYLLPK